MSEAKDMIYGLRPVIEALSAGKDIERVLIQNGLNGELATELKKSLAAAHLPFQFVPAEKLNGITRGNHQGVICFLSPVTYTTVEAILPGLFEQGKTPLFVLLDRITDVRNFGAIARTAECAGAHAIIIPEHGSARMSSDAVKTSAGALHQIPVCREKNIKQVIEYMKESGLQILACTEKASTPYYKTDMSVPSVIIMGSEEDGVSPEYLKRSDVNISIPLHGEIESLNVSVACGIVLFEAMRQRTL